ncbi:MAG: hypothetical protein G8345_02705 [Magnetococcales bacterium]|nr:hypothetical protein [Magnetococcales bacterium]
MKSWWLTAILFMLSSAPALADQTFYSHKVDTPPVIDGKADDPAWTKATPVITTDLVTGVKVTLKSVYAQDQIFMLVQFPDEIEHREHKTLLWDKESREYVVGPKREDTFVFKWNMDGSPIDLSLTSDTPNKTDVWYWKANRTDPMGYADDKMDIYSASSLPQSKKIISKKGLLFYLVRLGDSGKAAYDGAVYDEFVKPEMPGFITQQPDGSRADIRAKGLWQNKIWSVEFARKLQTGHLDDVQLETNKTYAFGISINEIAGRAKEPSIENPYFGSGEVGELLTLTFK